MATSRTTAAVDLRDRHCRYYLGLAEQATEGWATAVDRWARTVAADHENFRAALQWSLDRGDAGAAIRLCLGLEAFWKHARLFDEAERSFRRALAAVDPGEPSTPAVLGLNRVLWSAGRYRDAIELLEAASSALPEGDSVGRASVLVDLGWNHHYAGDGARATHCLRQAVDLLSAGPPTRGLVEALSGLGWRCSDEGDPEGAKALYTRALRSAEALRDVGAVADTWAVFANLLLVNGDTDASEAANRRSAELYRQVGRGAESIEQLRRLARSLRGRGARAEADSTLQRVLEEARQIGAEHTVAWASLDLATDALVRGDLAVARQHAEATASYLGSLPELSHEDAPAYSAVLEILAEVAYREGRTADARTALADATRARVVSAHQTVAAVSVVEATGPAILAEEHGDDAGAAGLFALVLPHLDGERESAAGAAWVRARIARLEGRLEAAVSLAEDAIATARRDGDEAFEARVRFELGRLWRQLGATSHACQELEGSLAMSERLGLVLPQARLHLELAGLARRDGRHADFERHREEVRAQLDRLPAKFVCEFVEELALHAAAAAPPAQSVALFASAAAWRERHARPVSTAVAREVAAALHGVERATERRTFTREWARGLRTPIEETARLQPDGS